MVRNQRSDICVNNSFSLFLDKRESVLRDMRAFLMSAIILLSAIMSSPNKADALDQCDGIKDHTANIVDFGAIGDGVNDDSAAFQRAVDCLARDFQPDGDQRAGAVLLAPSGRYRLDKPVRLTAPTAAARGQGLTIKGDGQKRSTILAMSHEGALQLHLAANRPWFNFFVTVRDIGFVAGVPGAGAAIEFVPIQASPDDNVPKVTAAIQDVSISAGGDDAFFDYGVKGAHLMLPVLEGVHMSGPRTDAPVSVACFLFEDSYGVIVDDSSCTGAEVGVLLPRSAEGNTIERSQFSNVNVGIKMEVVPGKGGPSSSGGKISDNYVEARREGIVVDGKTWFVISNNVLAMAQGGAATHVNLRDTQHVIVAGNHFMGGGGRGTGVAVLRGGKPWPGAASGTIISKNIFGPLAYAVLIGEGVNKTQIHDDTIHANAAIEDKGWETSVHDNTINERLSCRLAAWSPAVSEGGEGILVWDAKGAQTGVIDHGVGALDDIAYGSRRLRVSGSATFTARVRDADGKEATCSAPLIVRKQPMLVGRAGENVSVKSFGAKGDGQSDDTHAVENAVESVVNKMDADGAATLYFPAGTYKVSRKIAMRQSSKAWKKLTILGEGPSVSTIVTMAKEGIFDLQFSTQTPTEFADMKLVSEIDDASAAISVSMPPGRDNVRSLVVRNLRINGDETSRTSSFRAAIRGFGLSNPLLQHVRMAGYYLGTGFASMRRSGEACVLLQNGWGLELHDAYCTNMTNGFDVAVRGSDIIIWRGQALANVPDTGVRINAGGGGVTIDSAHVNAGTWNFDISNAKTVEIANTLTLNQDRAGEQADHGSVRVHKAQRVVIENNMFNQSGPLCPPPGNKLHLCYKENPTRVSVSIGQEVGNVTITGNMFNEPGAGVRLPAAGSAARITGNIFLKPSTDVDRGD